MTQETLEKEPQTLQQVYFQQSNLNRLELCMKGEDYPVSMLFSGPPGTGKTTTAKNFINAVRCINRPKHSPYPCGECDVCRSDPRQLPSSSNVLWIQRGNEQNLTQQLKEISDFIEQVPEGYGFFGQQEHTNRKFVVVDELWNLADTQIARLLYNAELYGLLKRNKVTFILVTMNESALKDVTREALVSRCEPFYFLPPNQEQIKRYLKEQYGEHPEESLELIAKACNNNLREAISQMNVCLKTERARLEKEGLSEEPTLNPRTVADHLHYFDDAKRIELWNLVQGKNAKNF
ncbi:MAG: AAA family ATPase, partial [Halobacteria archaeon]